MMIPLLLIVVIVLLLLLVLMLVLILVVIVVVGRVKRSIWRESITKACLRVRIIRDWSRKWRRWPLYSIASTPRSKPLLTGPVTRPGMASTVP